MDASLQHQAIKQLLQQKDDGNQAMVSGKSQDAVDIYTAALSRLEELKLSLEAAGAEALERSQLRATLLANRSQAHLNLKNWEDALADAESCLKVQPDNAKALHRKQLAFEKAGHIQGQRDFGGALKNALFAKSTGNQRLTEGDAQSAAKAYTSGLEWLEDAPASDTAVKDLRILLLSNRSQAHLKLQAWKEAIADADSVLQEDPCHQKAAFRRCKALIEIGKAEEALMVLKPMAEKDPANKDLHGVVAYAEQKMTSAETGASPEVEFEAKRTDRKVCACCGSLYLPNASMCSRCGEKRIQHRKQKQLDYRARAREMLRESETAFKTGEVRRSLEVAKSAAQMCEEVQEYLASGRAEARQQDASMRAGQSQPQTAEEETVVLLEAYQLMLQSQLRLREFQAAGETALRAIQLYAWEDSRLREGFGKDSGMQAQAKRMLVFEAVSKALELVQKSRLCLADDPREAANAASSALSTLDFQGDASACCDNLRADILAVRAEARHSQGNVADSELDAERALCLDALCRGATACLERLHAVGTE